MDYWLDSEDRIVKTDDRWLPFAVANGAPELTPEAVCGRHLAEFISDPTTVELWEDLLRRVREGRRLSIPIRCDAPHVRRRLELGLEPDGGLLRISSLTLSEELRPAIRLFELARPARGNPVVCCSWCRRFEYPLGHWVEVEDMIASSDIFRAAALPPLSHGICPECVDWVKAACHPERLH
jgi:hypothetical protein